jgi:hypothetical protein
MVIDGNKIPKSHLVEAKLEGERIRLPDYVVERGQHARFTGRAPIDALLLVVAPGRYRLVVKETPEAANILAHIEENEAPGELLERTGDSAQAAIGARLIPCSISPPPPGWRVNFPKVAKDLVSHKEDRTFVYLLIVAGYIEIWFPDTLRQAVSTPISELL